MADREVHITDSYLEKVKKLIPAEVSAAFLAINSLVPLNSENDIYVLSFFICLILICILYLKMLQNVQNLVQISFISLIAFPVWAINIAIARIDWLLPRAFIPACMLIIVTLLTPLLVRNQ